MTMGTLWRSSRIGIAPILLFAVALACGNESGQEPSMPAQAPRAQAPAKPSAPPKVDAVAEAQQVFETRCVTCHGPNGAGDGPASKGLTPPPRNFQAPAWQAEVSDEHLSNIIQYGGAAVGRSPTMPGNPDLTGKPEVVAALVAYLRNLKSD